MQARAERFLFFIVCAFVLAGAAYAASPLATRQELASLLALKEREPAAWQALLAEGKEHAFFCARCHGEDGNSVMALVPNLAGQNPYYLLEQIEKFADGRREDYIMSPLARGACAPRSA